MQKTRLVTQLLPIAACLLLTACQSGKRGDTTSLTQLKGLESTQKVTQAGTQNIRTMALRDTGVSIGAQAGLAARAKQLDNLLSTRAKLLDEVFNFNGLLLDDHILPPVLQESRLDVNLDSGNAIRLAQRTYKIMKQARFVTNAPDWREYLWMNYQAPERPDDTLLPKNQKEKTIWDSAVEQGWQHGMAQADTMFADNLAGLTATMQGMILYRKLLAQNMVSQPHVAKTDMGITGNSSEMSIGDSVLRITAMPGLQTNSRLWKPVVSR